MISRSYLRSSLEPLKLILHDRLSTTGMIILVAIISLALAAPLIATHDPWLILENEDASVLIREAGQWNLAPSLGILAISGVDTDGSQVVAVGREGTVHWFTDGEWISTHTPLKIDLNDVSINPDGDALVVGNQGTIQLWKGENWQVINPPVETHLNGVVWLDRQHALIVGDNEIVLLLEITQQTENITPLESPVGRGLKLNSVAVDIDGSALLVGERGIALRFNPESHGLRLQRMPSARDLNHIHISPNGQVLIVGERGTLIREVDGEWVIDDSPDSRALRAGWIDDRGDAIAVGRNGVILEFDGHRWTRSRVDTERHFRAVTMFENNIIALGTDPFVNKLAPPNSRNWFGTDHLGRDLFSQNVYGSRIALLVGFIGAALVVLIGSNVGLIAGYYRGRTDDFLMRTVDVVYSIPFEPFAMILVLIFDPSLTIVILAISLLTWRTVARLIRSQVLSLAERPFVKAAKVAGASDLRIMYLHIAPNVLPLIFLELAIIMGVAIIAEATLSFLGLGPPQSISWGGILHNARLSGAWRTAWWWNLPPGIFIMLTVLAVFFISRALEVIANPRLRTR
jgi:peptide/nickel transport system permease protein